MKRNIVKALAEASQTTLSKWAQDIDNTISGRKQERLMIDDKKKQILPKLLEAQAAGVSLRKLAAITGIPHPTIARWVKEAKGSVPAADTREAQKQEQN